MSASVAAVEPQAAAAAARMAGEASRSSGDWWLLGGVAAELAERLSVPVGFIRVLLVLASFAQGDVLLGYLALALLLPRAGARAPGPVNLIAAARIGIAIALGWGLAGGGVSLDQGVFGASPAVWVTQCGVCLAGLIALIATGVPAGERDPARDRRTVLVGGPLVGLAGVSAVGVVLVPELRWDQVLSVLTLLGGVGILADRRGRTAGLVVPAAVLAAATALLAGAGVRLDGGVGNARIAPTSATAVPAAYRRAVGDLTIDLTSLPASTAVVTVRASVGFGSLVIYVPLDAQVSIVERVGRGELYGRGGGGFRFGLDLRRTIRVDTLDPQTGRPLVGGPKRRLRILASVGIGHLDIERSEPRLGNFGPL